jgi:hypothetical protein
VNLNAAQKDREPPSPGFRGEGGDTKRQAFSPNLSKAQPMIQEENTKSRFSSKLGASKKSKNSSRGLLKP